MIGGGAGHGGEVLTMPLQQFKVVYHDVRPRVGDLVELLEMCLKAVLLVAI